MLDVVTLVLGPVETNVYLAADTESGDAVVIDPAWDGELITQEAEKRDWKVPHIWVTHAHFERRCLGCA